MRNLIIYKCFGWTLLFLIVLDPFSAFGQIGFKYKKWVKTHDYLIAPTQSGIIAPYRYYYEHRIIGKPFNSLWYVVSSTTGKIIEIFYFFPEGYVNQLRNYCQSSGYLEWDNVLGEVYYNVDNSLRFSYKEDKPPNKGSQLRISSMTPYINLISGWEKK